MASVTYDKASRVYGGGVRAVDELDLQIDDGEFLVLVGPSGSGKSTALRMLAGLEDTDEGAIHIGGRDVTSVAPKNRDIAMVFQSYALYPHMTVADNMGFALKLQKVAKAEREQRVRAAAEMLDLTRYLDRKPRALSGGQRQRVAMGRAIVREPAVFLMDEPLSNLDAKLRVETRANIAALQRRLSTTTLYVTHDQTEAMTMGDRVAVLRDGVLQQVDSPRNLYASPANRFVATFIGSPGMSMLPARIVDGGVQVGEHVLPVVRETADRASGGGGQDVEVGVRPEHLRLADTDADGFTVLVELVEELGSDTYVHGSVDLDGVRHRLTVRAEPGNTTPLLGQEVRVGTRPRAPLHLFDPTSGHRIP